MNWIDTGNYAAYQAALKERHGAFLRAVFAHVRANPGAAPAEVDAFADAQDPVWGVESNRAILARWYATLGLAGEAALALVRTEPCDFLLLVTDPGAGRPVLAGPDRLRLMAGGSPRDRLLWGADAPWGIRGETAETRDADNCLLRAETPVVIEGKNYRETVVYAWDKSGDAWRYTTSVSVEEVI